MKEKLIDCIGEYKDFFIEDDPLLRSQNIICDRKQSTLRIINAIFKLY